ncbi:tRNA lysidine(34) synthetase TilS [Alteromonas sp. H39]|uniref:tRNA lysidine(34) synthetase TilS n=1 Tax=Alteromonas sp. H39 TaxID=3389876 RepID=UPI0039E14D7B
MTETVIDSIGASLARLKPHTAHSLTVAYSGGVDSTLLLYAAKVFASAHQLALSACYINHGLSTNATAWQQHCADICKLLDVEFEAKSVSVVPTSRKSTEALARAARYTALLEHCLHRQSVLVLGQHQDDQLETVLLQLKRGAGPKGLAAMPEYQIRDGVVMIRPMLSLTREHIEATAKQLALSWIEDESNADPAYDRNFLRQHIIPRLQARWPSISETAARSAALCAEQQELVEQAAAEKLALVSKSRDRLDGAKLSALPVIWQRAVLRAWFTAHGTEAPSQAQLSQVISQLSAKHDARPEVTVHDTVLRRFQQDWFWTHKNSLTEAFSEQVIQAGKEVCIHAMGVTIYVSEDSVQGTYRLVPVSLNEKVKPQGEKVSKPVKQWMKANGIPPWLRQPAALLLLEQAPVACVYPAGILTLHALPPSVQVRAS